MKILALDLGKFNTMCCYFDTKTRKHEFINATTERNYLTTVLKKHPSDLVVMEACGPSGWIHDLATELGRTTIVCSTNEDAWKWSNVKRKTDKDDSLKLARMAASKELNPVHMPTPEKREWRSLIKFRKSLVHRVNRVRCSIRSLFVNHGITVDRTVKLWASGRESLNEYRKPIDQCLSNEFWKGQLDAELTQLDAIGLQLTSIEKKLDEIGKQDPRVVRVMTIDGVGPRTAEALVAAIDDPHRFDNARQVSAYFGLVPKQYQSGETDRNGRISKRGPSLVRTLLVQAAWSAVRHSEWAKSVYERISGKQKTRKKKAAIALARKIAVVAWAMLRDETNWDPKVMERVKILGKKKSTEISKVGAEKSEQIVPTSSRLSAPKEKKLSTTTRPTKATKAGLSASQASKNCVTGSTPKRSTKSTSTRRTVTVMA
jgi:transposase